MLSTHSSSVKFAYIFTFGWVGIFAMTRESTRISLINHVSLPFVVLFQFQHSLIRFKMAEIDAIFYDVTNISPQQRHGKSTLPWRATQYRWKMCSSTTQQIRKAGCHFNPFFLRIWVLSLMSQTVKVVTKCIKHINEIWGYILSRTFWQLDFLIKIQKYKEAA